MLFKDVGTIRRHNNSQSIILNYKSRYMSSALSNTVQCMLNRIPLQFTSTVEREPFFGDLACNKLYNLGNKQSIKSVSKPQHDQQRERTYSHKKLTSLQK